MRRSASLKRHASSCTAVAIASVERRKSFSVLEGVDLMELDLLGWKFHFRCVLTTFTFSSLNQNS